MTDAACERMVFWGGLAIAALGVLLTQFSMPAPRTVQQAILPPPEIRVFKASSIGEPEFAAQLIGLNVQGFDAQPGIKGTLNHLDYNVLERWLYALSFLDPNSDYTLQMALMYSRVNDPAKKRAMLAYVNQSFLENPNRRWRALAEAAVIARHELKDVPLALNYAANLEQHANGPEVPGWAQQMHALMLADIGDRERARIVLGGLLANGKVHNAHELRLLEQRLLTP